MTVEELQSDSDWAEVFADENSGNVSKDTEAVGSCSADPPPTRADVIEILALRNGVRDELGWIGAFLLKDGRFLFAEGSCDYTGWD